jgi:hypothetical protein
MIQPHEPLFKGMMFFIHDVGFVKLQYVLPNDKAQFENAFTGDVMTCPLSELKPIPLTEKILVEWCGFEKESDLSEKDATWTYKYIGMTCVHDERDEIGIFANGGNSFTVLFNGHTLTVILYLHHLQMLVQSLTNQPLKIDINIS